MTEFGYSLSSEQHAPSDLVAYARRAEEVGFDFAIVSDHYHPWIDRQGNSPFVWSVLGGIASTTERIRLGTGVTCPTIRIHPAIIAQAAATTAAMMPGRFFLGVGTGENLNEHILGDGWPAVSVRREMLEEAVEIIRLLWGGEDIEYYGQYFTVENARLYTLPQEPPPIYVAAAGRESAQLAAQIGDGLMSTSPNRQAIEAFGAGDRRPRYAEITVCYDEDEACARKTAFELWPNAAVSGELTAELPLPRHFEQAVKMVTEDQVAQTVVCGPDPQRYLESIRQYEDAGFDHLWVHNVAPEQEKFFTFFERQVLPQARGRTQARGAA